MSHSKRKIFLPIALALGSAFSATQVIRGIFTHSINNPFLVGAGSSIELASQPRRFWLMALSFTVLTIALAVGAYRVVGQKPAA